MPAQVLAHGLGDGGAQQVGEDLGLAALLAGLELDLAAEHVDRGLEVDDRGPPGSSSPCTVARCSAAAAMVSAPAMAKRALTPERWSTTAGLAQVAGEAGEDLHEVVGHVGARVGLLPDDRDLVRRARRG